MGDIKFIAEGFKIKHQEVRFDISKSSKTGKTVTLCTLKASVASPVIKRTMPCPSNVSGRYETFSYGDIFIGADDFEGTVTVRAKAICSDNDVYDVEKGKKIALAKAQTKLYSQVEREVRKNFEAYKNKMEEYIKALSKTAMEVKTSNDVYIKR